MCRAAPNTGYVPVHRVAPVNRSIMTSTNSRGKAVSVLPSNKRLPKSRSNSSASSTKSMAVMQSSLSSPSDAYHSPLYNMHVKSGHSPCSKKQHVEYKYRDSDNKKVRPYYVSFFQPVFAVYSFVMLLYCV